MKREHFLKPCPVCNSSGVSHEITLNKIELLHCDECGFVYANQEDTNIKSDNSKFGREAIEAYKAQQTFIDDMWFKMIVKKLTNIVGESKGRKILDIGCGNGLLLRHFIDQKWSSYGLDLSPWAKDFAQIYNYQLYSCELEKSGLQNNYFDLVTSTSTLEHIPKPRQHIREIIRILKPGGIAYFCGLPNYGSLPCRLRLSSFYHNIPPKHVNYFTRRTMHRLFTSPDIAGSIKDLSIISYGIPEMHRIYNLTSRFISKTSKRSTNNSNKSVTSRNSICNEHGLKSSFLETLAKLLITTNCNLGRPFCLGGKLEVIAVKK